MSSPIDQPPTTNWRTAVVFVAFCPRHDCEVLLGASCLRGLTNLAAGVLALELECYDGERLVVLTGSHTARPADSGARR